MKSLSEETRRIFLAALSGFVLSIPFFKATFWPTAWPAFVPLLLAIGDCDIRRGALAGIISGLTFYIPTLYWVVYAQTRYGGIPTWIAILALLALAGACSAYWGFFGALVSFIREKGGPWLETAPFAWVAQEYMMSHFPFGGFPWNLTGYSQIRFLPIIQVADLGGVYLVSFLVVLGSAALAGLVIDDRFKRKRAALAAVAFGASLIYGTVRLDEFSENPWGPKEKAFKTAIVQGNIDQSRIWDNRYKNETLNIYQRMSEDLPHDTALIIWPESAVPFFIQQEEAVRRTVAGTAVTTKAWLIFGAEAWEMRGTKIRYFNSAFLMDPAGRITGRYDKVHLVPFGEYVPLRKILPFLEPVASRIGEFHPGEKLSPLSIGAAKAGVLICFEAIFPSLSRQLARDGASFIVNLTNDAWYGRSTEPEQHLNMTAMRAVETRLPIARSTGTGISAFIDRTGKIHGATRLYTRATITGILPSISPHEMTLYTRTGDLFSIFCLLITLFLVLSACLFGLATPRKAD